MMKKLKPWLVLALVFVAGFTTGVVVTRGAVRHFIQQAVANPSRVRDLIEKRLTVQLRLDGVQRDKVHQILVASQKDLRALRGEFSPRFLEILEHAETRIAETLRPEQRARLEKFREENRQFWEPKLKP